MYSVSKLAVAAAVLVLVLVVAGSAVVDARFPKTKVVSPLQCEGTSSKEYNEKLRHLLDFFVDETKNTFRNPGADYVNEHSYPNRDMAGSVTGVATCNKDLEKLDCWSCLRTTKEKINSHCKRAASGSLGLQDCSITFKNVA